MQRKKLRKIMYYGEEQKLGLNEYREVLLDNISRLVTNQRHIDENSSVYETFIFKSYEKYANSKTENYSINQIITLLEIFLDAVFKYKMDNELPDDVITIY